VISKIIGLVLVVLCIAVSLLRGLGVLDGDFIIPLILLSQLFILGYLVQFVQMVAKDIVIRYTKPSTNNNIPPMNTWN
jgi:hypothetical protein